MKTTTPVVTLACPADRVNRVFQAPRPNALWLADLERHEAYRFATGIIAQAEECMENCRWEDIAEALEARGFEPLEVIIGPALD